mgnify:CR=1 FL=1
MPTELLILLKLANKQKLIFHARQKHQPHTKPKLVYAKSQSTRTLLTAQVLTIS